MIMHLKTGLLLAVLYLVNSFPTLAQLHYQGHHGIQAEYGLQSQFSDLYGIGYQFFFNNRLQLEFMGGYERGSYQRDEAVSQYDATVVYNVENVYLHETLNYSFLRAFKRMYFNIGLGLTQTYQQGSTSTYTFSTDSVRLAELDNPAEFDPNSVEMNGRIRFGGHANALLEFYVSRYFTLLARHRLVYLISSQYEPWDQQTSVGLRVNF
ncbi:hypothetical protein [Tunicatimonas pelagia]|uniref:hypothetical protein n=1 Tax=Tunicatimonas pelagia TaxID=931531 RepID=UPI00266659BB|nr:hypothetical protein [Tunicatimonas pelagia]WKN46485.1 hypothetical protein P0M28_30510 [Tunicatimonas pelagia]